MFSFLISPDEKKKGKIMLESEKILEMLVKIDVKINETNLIQKGIDKRVSKIEEVINSFTFKSMVESFREKIETKKEIKKAMIKRLISILSVESIIKTIMVSFIVVILLMIISTTPGLKQIIENIKGLF